MAVKDTVTCVTHLYIYAAKKIKKAAHIKEYRHTRHSPPGLAADSLQSAWSDGCCAGSGDEVPAPLPPPRRYLNACVNLFDICPVC